MGYFLWRSILFFLGNMRVFGCLRPEWPQGSEVCCYIGFESALGYALDKKVFDALLFVYLFAAAAEVVVTESQPECMSPYKAVAREGI